MPASRRLLPAALALALAPLAPRAAAAGPPWIGVELPANPHDPATRGALAVVRLYHHGERAPWPLEARAVGSVGGAPRTLPLEVRRLADGSAAVRGALPAGDGWVLVLTAQTGPGAHATALVALDRRGEVAGVRVPSTALEGGRWLAPRDASAGEVDAMLRRAVAAAPDPAARVGAAPPAPDAGRGGALAGAALALLAPLGARRALGARR